MTWKWKKGEHLYYEDIFRKLQEKNIRYLIIGGVAVNLHGIQRATGDVDLMLDMEKDNVLKFISIMKELGMIPKVPVNPEDLADPKKVMQWQEEKNMKVFSYTHPDNPYITVDIMTSNPINFDDSYQERKTTKAWGVNISLIGKKDLIKLKEIAGREQDLADIENLEKYVRDN
jgi:predicted nucleotidyltransferase